MNYKKYFLKFMIAMVVMFLFGCLSLFYCIKNVDTVSSEQAIGHTLSFSYIFIHLILLAAVFIFALKAYLTKSTLLSVFMTTEKGEKNPKAYNYCMFFSIIFCLIGLFFALNALFVLPIWEFFSVGFSTMMTNVSFSVVVVCIFMMFFKPENDK